LAYKDTTFSPKWVEKNTMFLYCVRTKLTKKQDKNNAIKSLTFIHSL